MSKAKPMVLGSAIIWFAIFIHYSFAYGTAKNVVPAFQSKALVIVQPTQAISKRGVW
jgi:hypothetical protein